MTTPDRQEMEIFLVDGIGPFFRNYRKKVINWSKIPFERFSFKTEKFQNQFRKIAAEMEIFTEKVAAEGYNAISLDDVPHLAPHPWLEPEIQARVELYRQEFRKIFTICRARGLAIYLTMDVLSLTESVKEKIASSDVRALLFLSEQLEMVLDDFPEISGVIMRIGESDGLDVKGDFRSELMLQTPAQVNRMLRRLLPLFETRQRFLILRSWTVGAYRIGDFIWHRNTMQRALRKVNSPNFILSMKYGESDFFRYLPLNGHFFRIKVKKMIELQAKREYEGAGEYPSFVGWDYEKYKRDLQDAENVVGMSVWCQTGGWLPFRRRTYLDPKGMWNELNSAVTLRIFKYNESAEEAAKHFAGRIGCMDPEGFIFFLRLNDFVIKELLYTPEIASRKLFFRRVRIPPLLSVFWNNIFINHSVRKIFQTFSEDGEKSVKDGWKALETLAGMRELAVQLNLPDEDIEYMYLTFEILALAREYYFLPYDDQVRERIRAAKKRYKKKYASSRPRYRVKTNFTRFFLRRRHLRWILRLSLRSRRGYRVLDYLFTLHLLAALYRIVVWVKPTIIPKFARKRAMGLDTLFR